MSLRSEHTASLNLAQRAESLAAERAAWARALAPRREPRDLTQTWADALGTEGHQAIAAAICDRLLAGGAL